MYIKCTGWAYNVCILCECTQQALGQPLVDGWMLIRLYCLTLPLDAHIIISYVHIRGLCVHIIRVRCALWARERDSWNGDEGPKSHIRNRPRRFSAELIIRSHFPYNIHREHTRQMTWVSYVSYSARLWEWECDNLKSLGSQTDGFAYAWTHSVFTLPSESVICILLWNCNLDRILFFNCLQLTGNCIMWNWWCENWHFLFAYRGKCVVFYVKTIISVSFLCWATNFWRYVLHRLQNHECIVIWGVRFHNKICI
jgi:hypothetical protein